MYPKPDFIYSKAATLHSWASIAVSVATWQALVNGMWAKAISTKILHLSLSLSVVCVHVSYTSVLNVCVSVIQHFHWWLGMIEFLGWPMTLTSTSSSKPRTRDANQRKAEICLHSCFQGSVALFCIILSDQSPWFIECNWYFIFSPTFKVDLGCIFTFTNIER